MVSRTALCTVTGEWEGGDDSDSTYVPGDWYAIRVECGDDLASAAPHSTDRWTSGLTAGRA